MPIHMAVLSGVLAAAWDVISCIGGGGSMMSDSNGWFIIN